MSEPVTQSIQDRCPRMREHRYSATPLPTPCPDCYSVRVTAERLPWQPEVRWHPVTTPRPEPQPEPMPSEQEDK